jgi:acetone carboxylase gamma subunit
MPFSEFAKMFKETISKEIKNLSPVVDRKNFLEMASARFLECNFGLEFADPRGIWKIRQITPEILGNLANSHCHAQKKLKLQFLKNRQ